MARALGAEIAAMLKDRGVEVIFGIPGVHNVELYRGIEDAGITHVLARHEGGAGFMADGYARATGKPGVAFVITGPGLTNAMTPLGQAYSDSVPMLVISSGLNASDLGRRLGRLHEMRDQVAAAATVTEWAHIAHDDTAALALIDRALAEFQTMRPRPRNIQVPIEVLGAPSAAFPPAPPHAVKPQVPAEMVYQAAEMINAARRPLFLFGGGSVGGVAAARKLLETCKAASFTTYAAGGMTALDDGLAFGSYLGRPDSEAVVQRADLIVAVGTELSETDLWRDRLGRTSPMIRVDIDPVVVADREAAELQVLGDAAPFLAALSDAVSPVEKSGWSAKDVTATRVRWKAEVDAARPGIVPVCDALREALPDDTMIYSDMTQFAYVGKEVWDQTAPGLWHHPTGFGTLGFALPAAIGGAVARRGQPTVVIAGDYGFQYTVQELGTAVELGLSLPILLWDNGKLKEIEDCMVESQIAPNAVVARNPDFLALARAYGAGAEEPATLVELQEAVIRALQAPGPTLIRMTEALTQGATG